MQYIVGYLFSRAVTNFSIFYEIKNFISASEIYSPRKKVP